MAENNTQDHKLPDPFGRLDASDDALFYATPRKVTHIEQGAISALQHFYAENLPSGGEILDLMSSWRSHLPEGLGPVTGLGMNSEEMADNPQLDTFTVHNLNKMPLLPFEENAFDAVVCAVSVQYLEHPVHVFSEVQRVLRPNSPVIVSFSNRCFPTKAVNIWRYSTSSQHQDLVRMYLEKNAFHQVSTREITTRDDPMYIVSGVKPHE